MNIKSFCKACACFAAAISISTLLPCASAGTLGDAVDNTDLTWTTGGDASWFYQTAVTHDGVDAAQCGQLAGNWQSSYLETTVTGQVAVVFWWKVSSDPTWTECELLVNNSYACGISGETDWQPRTVTFDSGTNTLQWIFYSPPSGPPDWNDNAAWLDQVIVTNVAGLKPTILFQPPASILIPDSYPSNAYIHVAVVGEPSLSYQWLLGGTNLQDNGTYGGLGTPDLSLWIAPTNDAGDYQLAISNAWGVVTSEVATVSITPSKPYIWPTDPGDAEVALGDYCWLSIYAYGTPPFTYHWEKDGVPLSAATNYYFWFEQADLTNSGNYRVIVANDYGSCTSRVAQITVSADPPVVDSGPAPESYQAQPGDWVSFYVNASGPQQFYYEWRKTGEDAVLSSDSGLYFDSADPTNSGLYYAIIANLNGSVTSRVCVLAVAPTTLLGVALDEPQWIVTNNLDWNQWFPDVEGTNAHDGLCALRSPQIYDWDSGSFSTTVTGPTNVSFWWRISAGAEAYLDIAVDEDVSNTISGMTPWQQQTLEIPNGEHTLTWTFRKDEAGSAGDDAAWVDQLTLGTGGSVVGNSYEITNFTTGGDADWFLETTEAQSPPDAWQSGVIGDYGETRLHAQVSGPGTLSFNWSVESEEYCDYLGFFIDGVEQTNISGSVAWQQAEFVLDDGPHELEWRYSKDGSVSVGTDAGWVDDVTFTPPPGSVIADFTTGGDADWFLETAEVQSPPDAWQSGVIGDNDETWLRAGVTGPGMLSFSWAVDSEENCDYLRFVVDGVEQTNVSGSVAWQQQTFVLGDGPHELEWRYSKDGSVSQGADAGWVDSVTWSGNATPPLTLAEALDAPGLVWECSGDAPWFAETTNVLAGSSAAQSGRIAENQRSRLQTTINGPGTVSFGWAVDCDDYWNNLVFDIDDAYQDDIAGSIPWRTESYDIGPGPHVLTWTYYKDDAAGVGADAGWVDDVAFTEASAPTINWGPINDSVKVGKSASFDVSASGTALHYQWYRDGVAIPDATDSNLRFTVSESDAGYYYVVITNWVDSIESFHAKLTVLVPPQIAAQSPDQSVYIGSVLLLRVDVRGTGPFSYAWFRDGTFVTNGASSVYACAGVQSTDAGAYTVEVTGPGGYTETTTPITVAVQPVPDDASPGTVDRSFNFGLGVGGAYVLALTNGQLLIGGSFSSVNGVERHGLARLNADGSLDLLWDAHLNPGANVNAMLAQPGGGVLIGGWFTNLNGLGRTNVARLNSDGSPDTSFNAGSGPNGSVTVMTATPDGGALIAGYFTGVAGLARTNLAKLTATGAADPAFNSGTGTAAGYKIEALACQGDRILVGGYFHTFSGNSSANLLRLKSDGSFDPDFTAGNAARNGLNGDVYSIAVQADGRVLVAGIFDAVGTATNGGLVRLATNGLYDSTFNPPLGLYAAGDMVKVLGNGQILFGGRYLSFSPSYNDSMVVRLNPDGSVDGGFSTNAVVVNDRILALDVTQDGHVLVAGSFNKVNGMVSRGVTTLNANGTLDSYFRPGLGTSGAIQSIAVQADGKILIGGSFTNVDYISRNGVARLLSDGSIDPDFNPGAGAFSGGYYGPYVRAVVTDSNGCVLVAGGFTNFNGTTAARIVRLLPNGTADDTFASPFGITGTLALNAVAMQTDGKILVGGNFNNVAGVPTVGIARLLTNGIVDESFQATNTGGSVFVIRISPTGQIYVGGEYTLFARLNPDGPRDSTFTPSGLNIGGSVYAMELQPDGRIIIGNDMSVYGSRCLARFNPDGTLDSSFYSGFGTAGVTITALALQADGHLVVGGQFSYFNDYARQRLARVNADGSLDMLFDPKTSLSSSGGGSGGSVYALSALPDGRVLVGGQFTSVSDRTMSSSASVTLGRDNLMALNTENPAVDAMPVAPAIITQPQNANVNVSGSLTLGVVAVGTPILKYQWYKNSRPMIGEVESTLTLNPICRTNAGAYYVTVGNSVDTRQSWTANVYVYPPYSWNASSRTLTLNWNAVPGHTYRVLRNSSGDLAHPGDPAWTIEYEVTATSVNCWWTSIPIDLSSHASGFYRLVDMTTP
jgi:uncharacterized delta-60 repeat protein